MGRRRIYKRELHFDLIGGHRHMEAHYADMARRGWMLERLGAVTHRYKAAEPQERDVRFCVDVLPDIGSYDYPHSDNALSYRAMCEDAGWELVAQRGQTHVFRAKDADSPPLMLHTDVQEQNRIYMRAYRKSELFGLLYALIVLPLILYGAIFGHGVTNFLHNMLFTTLVGIPIVAIATILYSLAGLVWYIQLHIAYKRNLPPPVINRRFLRIVTGLLKFGMAFMYACILAGSVLEVMGGLPLVTVIFPFAVMLIMILAGMKVQKKIETEERSKRENIALMAHSVIVTGFFTFFILLIGAGFLPQPETRPVDVQTHPAITLNTLNMPPHRSIRAAERGTSIVVPVHYVYSESSWHESVSTTVQRSVSTTIARWLFNDWVDTMLAWHSRFNITRAAIVHYHRMDSAEAALWGADEGVITITENEDVSTKLRSGRTLVFVSVSSSTGVDMDLKRQAVLDLWGELAP